MAKRLLMLCWEYPPRIIGGLARVVGALALELANLNYEIHVVTADHPGAAEHEIQGNLHIHRVKTQTDTTPDFVSWVNRLNFGLLQYALAIHKDKPFDLIHAHDWMVTDSAWVLKSAFGIPIVTTIHATESGRMHGIHNDLQRYIHQVEWRLTYESWRVIVNSKHMSYELNNLFNTPLNKIDIIPNGTYPKAFDISFDYHDMRNKLARPYQKIVLYVGRMVREKGAHVLLEAAAKIIPQLPGTRFLMVGTGYYLDDLKAMAYHYGIGDDVSFLGYVDDDELKRIYKIADAVVIPSLYEPFGIVALEGMAAQVPVVCSDTGGLLDFVEHMHTGVTTYAGDANSLAWGILQVLKDEKLKQHLIKTAHAKVNKIYNWEVIAKQTANVYEQVLSESLKIGKAKIALKV